MGSAEQSSLRRGFEQRCTEVLAEAACHRKLAFMAGVGMAWSTFVVSGTMTG